MKLLAIDTVFDKCGVAILVDGDIIYYEEQTGKRQQTQQILPMIDTAMNTTKLKLDELDGLVFNRGPGAFSGIRINTAVVQALSFAHDIACIGVSSLQVLAQSAFEQYGVTHGYAVLDARMKQVYLGEYQLKNGIMQLMVEGGAEEMLLDYGKSTDKNLPLLCLSTDDKDLLALQKGQEEQERQKEQERQDDKKIFNNAIYGVEPNAKTLAKLGANQFIQTGGVSAEQALPVYLRNNAWKTLNEQGKQASKQQGKAKLI